MTRILLPRDIEVVVSSFGGVGTTFLLSHISEYKKTNNPQDKDTFKHQPLPPVAFRKDVRFIYVHGSPQLAAFSLFRRGYQRTQSKKLEKRRWQTVAPIPEDMTLAEYASKGVDRFNFRNHFLNWYHRYLPPCPTMFIRYNAIFENVAALGDFLGLPKSFGRRFPEKKERTSRRENIEDSTLRRLDSMYGGFDRMLSKLEDVEIRQKRSEPFFGASYLNRAYLRALGVEVFGRLNVGLKAQMPKAHEKLRQLRRLADSR